jgi:hypothetical protein
VYEPTSPELVIAKSRISADSWSIRVEIARQHEKTFAEIARRVKKGSSLNRAIAQVVERSKRSWVMRHWKKYQERGFEALIDARTPREPKLSRVYGDIIQTAKLAKPNLTAEEMVGILKEQKFESLPSLATIQREFAKAKRRANRAEKKPQAVEQVIEVPLAGGELLMAAELETGGIGALADEVKALGEEAVKAAAGQTPVRDVADRDELGRFTVTYNRKRRRKRDEEVAPYMRSAAEKAEGRVPSWPRFAHERRETLELKMRTLALAPLVSETKGWNALRASTAAGLGPLTGYAYMPSTLAKFTSALAISGSGPRLLKRAGSHWHQVARERWDEGGAMAALYIDNHAKEVWTSLFMKSGKVSHLNRVMPCITTTYIHTGAGTPLVASVQSGGAPLAARLATLVEQAEAVFESGVQRAVVIDAEGSTFDVLESFTKKKRVIVTPLRPSRAPELELRYSRGSYYRPYRDKDELRIATATLTHKSTGRSLEVGALLIRREHRKKDTVLLTTGLALGMEGKDLADMYFARWPIQENAFKEGAAVGLDEHRGNCGRMVNNVAVITELERIEKRIQVDQEKQRTQAKETKGLKHTLEEAQRQHKRADKALIARRHRLDQLIKRGRTKGKQLGSAAIEHQRALAGEEATRRDLEKAQQKLERHEREMSEREAALAKLTARQAHLEPQRKIRQLDVAQDSILTAVKLTVLQLIAFVLREYLPSLPMTAQTFISRVFSTPGRRILYPDWEFIIFHENPRDPEITAALRDACRRLNLRKLERDGRRIRYVVLAESDEPPAPGDQFD